MANFYDVDQVEARLAKKSDVSEIRNNIEPRLRSIEVKNGTESFGVTDGQVASVLSKPDSMASDSLRRINSHRDRASSTWRGVSVRTWSTGYLNSGDARDETRRILENTGGDSINLCVNIYQRTKTDSGGFIQRTSISEIEDYVKWAHGLGYRVMLKPHIETYDSPYVWRAYIDPADPTAWFSEYRDIILSYADLAARLNVACISVGSELTTLSTRYPDRWRGLIRLVRERYSGLLTYGASLNSSGDEAFNITFWDALDFIGLDLYIRLPSSTITKDQMYGYIEVDAKNGSMMETIDALARQYGRPVALAEYGVPLGPDSNHVKDYTNEWYAEFVSALWRSFMNRDWFIGGAIWAVDALGMQKKEYAPGSMVLMAMREAHSIVQSYSRPSSGVYSASTWHSGETPAWVKICDITVPRTWAGLSTRVEITGDTPTSTVPDHAVFDVRVGRGSRVELDVSIVRLEPESTMSPNRVGYTVNKSTLTLWAQTRSGQGFQTSLDRATTPSWVSLLHQASGMQTDAPEGLNSVSTVASLTTTSITPELQSGTKVIPWSRSGGTPWWKLNGPLTISLASGPSGLTMSRLFKFEQDSAGYRTISLNGVSTPAGAVRLARSPGAVTWVEFYWDGSSWYAWTLDGLKSPDPYDLTPSISAESSSTIRLIRSGSFVQVTFDINNAELVPGGSESTIFYMGEHVPYSPIRGIFSTLDTPAAGWVRTDGNMVKVKPVSGISPGRKVQGTLTWITNT